MRSGLVVDSVKTLESEDDTQFIQGTECMVGNPEVPPREWLCPVSPSSAQSQFGYEFVSNMNCLILGGSAVLTAVFLPKDYVWSWAYIVCLSVSTGREEAAALSEADRQLRPAHRR